MISVPVVDPIRAPSTVISRVAPPTLLMPYGVVETVSPIRSSRPLPGNRISPVPQPLSPVVTAIAR